MFSIDIRKYHGEYEVFVEQEGGDFSVSTFTHKYEAEKFIACLTAPVPQTIKTNEAHGLTN